jgi:ATP-dependent exoDNAse (exonuclease V) beta subunit
VLDYKTSYVNDDSPQALAEHARRFHLQVGVYAAAAREQLGGITPSVYIHYIRYWQTIHVPDQAWQHALATIEDQIGSLMGEPS